MPCGMVCFPVATRIFDRPSIISLWIIFSFIGFAWGLGASAQASVTDMRPVTQLVAGFPPHNVSANLLPDFETGLWTAEEEPPTPDPEPPMPSEEEEAVGLPASSAPETESEEENGKGSEEKEDEGDTIEAFVEGFERIDGLFPLYQDPDSGSVYMEIAADLLETDLIYFTYTHNGAREAGFIRGGIGNNRILEIRHAQEQLEFVAQNTGFYFDPASPLARTAPANISPAVLASVEILAQDPPLPKKDKKKKQKEEDSDTATEEEQTDAGTAAEASTEASEAGTATLEPTEPLESVKPLEPKRFLIDAGDLLLAEKLPRLRSPEDREESGRNRFAPGPPAKDRTRFAAVRNYPNNTDLVVDYVMASKRARSPDGEGITDGRAVSVRLQHSFILRPLPETDEAEAQAYQPRAYDYRVGFFQQRRTDLTSTSNTPYRDLIERWDLRKKEPEAALSEPVEPIVFWIDRATPFEYRDVVRDATLKWNLAFEQAGFKDAIQVRTQPDDATWDAGDIRYNVIRWASSPEPFFSGFGPSASDPRTGEIVAGDVELEFIFVTNRLLRQRIFQTAALDGALADLANDPLASQLFADALSEEQDSFFAEQRTARDQRRAFCAAGQMMQLNALFAAQTLQARGAGADEMGRLLEEALTYLVLHEVGHVLGLSHNMQASTLHPFKDLHDRELTSEVGLVGSVMEYPGLNLARDGEPQGEFFPTRPGPYDVWAIQYGYTPPLADAQEEADRVAGLLAQSADPALAFANDAEDMRSAGRGLDPRAMTGDLSRDPIDFAEDRLLLLKELKPVLEARLVTPGETYQTLRDAYFLTTREQSQAARILSRQVGGVLINRAMPDQPGAGRPFTPVPATDQRRALSLLADHIFAPEAFEAPESLIAHLQVQRRGFDLGEGNEDPQIHARALRIQQAVLAHLLHPNVLERLTDAGLYGGDFTVNEMLAQLTDAVFEADARGSVNSFRRNLQTSYVERLIGLMTPDRSGRPQIDAVARAEIYFVLTSLDEELSKRRGRPDAGTIAHRAHLRFLLQNALEGPGRG